MPGATSPVSRCIRKKTGCQTSGDIRGAIPTCNKVPPPLQIGPKVTVEVDGVVLVVGTMQEIGHPSQEQAPGANDLAGVIEVA